MTHPAQDLQNGAIPARTKVKSAPLVAERFCLSVSVSYLLLLWLLFLGAVPSQAGDEAVHFQIVHVCIE
jgi:hypothetical protein